MTKSSYIFSIVSIKTSEIAYNQIIGAGIVKGSGVGAVLDKNKTSKIGILLPLSGDGEEDGRAFLDAMQLAFFEVANKNLKLYIADTKGSRAGAAESIQKLITEDVGLILGPLFSESTEAIAPLARARTDTSDKFL